MADEKKKTKDKEEKEPEKVNLNFTMPDILNMCVTAQVTLLAMKRLLSDRFGISDEDWKTLLKDANKKWTLMMDKAQKEKPKIIGGTDIPPGFDPLHPPIPKKGH